jgi:hypothetical protein
VYINPGVTRLDTVQPDAQPVAGAQSTFALPVGATYDALYLLITNVGGTGCTRAQILADIARVVLEVDGRPKWDITAVFLDYINDYYAAALNGAGAGTTSPGNNGILPLMFAEHWRKPVSQTVRDAKGMDQSLPAFSEVDGPAYGTLDVNTFTLRITWGAGPLTATRIQAFASTRPGTKLGSHITLLPLNRNFAGAGTDIISSEIPGRNGDGLTGQCAMHIADGALLTNVEVLLDRAPFLRLPRAVMVQEQAMLGQRTINANLTTIDWSLRNRLSDVLPEVWENEEVRLTFGAPGPGPYQIILERLELQEVQPVQKTR